MSTRRLVGVAVAVLIGLALTFGPAPIDPVAWTPSVAMPLDGALAPNTDLRPLRALPLPQAEDLAVDGEGRVYGGAADGRILRLRADGAVEEFADTGGRPLGLDWHPDGRLVVADAERGLLAVGPDGEVEVLATEAEGVPFRFADDVDVAADGRIFFTDASDTFDHHHYTLDVLEGRPHGRLLVHEDGETRVLLRGLYFANGVAVSHDGASVLVNETTRYRITRYWLEGPKAGTSEPFIEGLPGFPDGISAGLDGVYWVALFSVRKPIGDWLAPKVAAKRLVSRLPGSLLPKAIPYGLVLAVSGEGEILASLHDPGGEAIHPVTSVEEVDGQLLIGSLSADHVGTLAVPEGIRPPPRIAITIDDLPFLHHAPGGREAATDRLLEALTSRGITATGFAICDASEPPHELLRRWLDAGQELAGHHATHTDLNDTPPDEWLADAHRCNEELRSFTAIRFFRYPYLHRGASLEVRDRVRRELEAADLTIAPVSVDNHEWKLGKLYADAMLDGRAELAGRIAEYYVQHMLEVTAYYQAVARRKLGGDVAHVLLFHGNALAADHIGDVLDALSERGFEFVTLAEALADPVYAMPDAYVGPGGISWLSRIEPVDYERAWEQAAWDEIVERFED